MQVKTLGHDAELRAEFAKLCDRDAGRAAPRLIDLIGRPQRRPAPVEPIGLVGFVRLLAGLEFSVELGAPCAFISSISASVMTPSLTSFSE